MRLLTYSNVLALRPSYTETYVLQGIVHLFHRLQKQAKAIDAQARYSIKKQARKCKET